MAVTFQKNTAQTVDEIASLDAEIASLKRIRTELMERALKVRARASMEAQSII